MGELTKLCSVKNPKGKAWEHMVDGQSRITHIYVSHSSFTIDFLQFVTVDALTSLEVCTSKKYGGQAGNKFNVVQLKANERITSVSGQHCFENGRHVLSSILFGTNLGSYGPFGCPKRFWHDYDEFNFEVGQILCGFHGTTLDGQLESFGVFVGVNEPGN